MPNEVIRAYHEAGHAIMAMRYHLPFEYLTIEPAENFIGPMRDRPWDTAFAPDRDWIHKHGEQFGSRVPVMLGGPIAQAIHTGHEIDRASDDDFRRAIDMAYHIEPDEEVRGKYIDYMAAKIRHTLKDRWRMAGMLARMLLKQRTIVGGEAAIFD